MKAAKRKKLEQAGWRVGSAADFLGLSAEESALIAMKLALADRLRAQRERLKLSQADVARRLHSSQSRVAKMEAADRTVTLDLLVRSLLSLGVSTKELGKTLATSAA
jgi:hypothetical protein